MSKIIKGAKINQNPLQLESNFIVVAPIPDESECLIEEVFEDEPAICLEQPEDPADVLKQAKLQADLMLTEAEATARKIIEETQQQAIQVQDEAQRHGHTTGYEEGRQQGYQSTEELLAVAAQIVERAKEESTEIMDRCERDILELAIAVATRVIHTEVTINQDVVLAVVKDAIRKAKDQEKIVIRINPVDFETVAAEKQNLQVLIGREMGVDVRGDISVDPGGCVVETDFGAIDARIDTQLDTIKKALLGMVKHG